MTFYVPFPEADALASLDAINTAAVAPITTYVSIAVIADGTVIWYDHWEDGYEKSHHLNTPVQPTTQIWGDGNPDNGFAPGHTNDILRAGDVVLLYNTVDPASPYTVDYDARDKIVANRAIAVTRTYWAADSGTLMAGSVETYDTSKWGTDYRAPVGENIPDGYNANSGDHQMFEYTGLSIMAAEDGTVVQIDADNNGTFETSRTLNEGECAFVNGGVSAGGHVVSSKPVQVLMFTGDVGSNYETRDSTLLPVSLWSSSYYTPVATASGNGTRVWLYNPSASAITVKYRSRLGAGTTVTTNATSVAAGSYASVLLNEGSGTQFFTEGSPAPVFYAYSTTDSDSATTSDNQSWDWSFTLIPQPLLTPQVLVGLGIGRDPLSATNPEENGNPIWVTTVGNGEANATVYVDYNGDNAGPYVDPNGNRYDTSLSARELQPLKIYDPDGDQTAMLIYVLATNVSLAAAWGQDPSTASASAPGLDAGTAVPPVDVLDVSKPLALVADADGDGQLGPGERVSYEITIGNTSRAPVPADLIVQDTLPEDTVYVAGSAAYRTATNGAWTAIADDASGTAFPLDGAGFHIRAAIPVHGIFAVRFQAGVDAYADLTPGRASIVNAGTVTSVAYGRTLPFKNETYLHGSLGDRVWYDSNGNGVQDEGEAGINGVVVYLDRNTNGVRDAGERCATTFGDGFYLLTNALIEAGTHLVRVDRSTLPDAGFTETFDLDGVQSADAASVVLAAGQDRTDVDFGYCAFATLSGSVLLDVDGDGVADAEDTEGLFGVTVTLLDAQGDPVASASTSATGYYEFAGVPVGGYTVVQSLPSGYSHTADTDGAADGRITVTLTDNQNSAGNVFYDARPGIASIQNKVLYLSDPAQSLDRIDPVASGDATTATTALLSALAVDRTTSYNAASAKTFSFTHTTGTGADRLLLVGVAMRQGGTSVKSVTYGSQPLTLVGAKSSGSDTRVEIWSLVAPLTGAHSVVVNLNAKSQVTMGATTFTGVDQTAALGTFVSASGSYWAPNVTVASAAGELVFDTMGSHSTWSASPDAGQTGLWYDASQSQLSGGASLKAGASSVTMQWSSVFDAWALGAVPVRPSSVIRQVTFVQSPTFAAPFAVSAGAEVRITNYVEVVGGTLPANPAVTATLAADGVPFLTLRNPVYSSAAGALVWSATLANAVPLAAGQAISLAVSNAQDGVQFRLRYDSATYPSKIVLPTATVIEIRSLEVFDAAYPGGRPVSSSPVGSTRYIRLNVTDPFGATDITGAALAIDLPGSPGDLSVTLDDAHVVASGSGSKTYEYAWQTPRLSGGGVITATAREGSEGIVATAATAQTLYEAAVGDRVFADYNTNGVWDAGEGLAGVSVTLRGDLNGDGSAETAEATTGADGFYSFGDLRASSVGVAYTVSVDRKTLPAGLSVNSADPDGGGDGSGRVTLTLDAPSRTDQDFGFVSPALHTIKGQVRDDYDFDGALDDPDRPAQGVTVELHTDPNGDGNPADGVVLQRAVTAPDGRYAFSNLLASAYVVVVVDPPRSYGTGDAVDANDSRVPVSLVDGDSDGNDFLVAIDPSGYLYDVADGRIVPGGSIAVDGPGAVVLMSGVTGEYMFISTNRTAALFTVKVTPPTGYLVDPTRPPAGAFFDATSAGDLTVLGSGESVSRAGYLASYSAASNTYYFSFELAPGDPAVIHNNIPLVKSVAVGDRVWVDTDGDGAQDAAEAGLANVTVRLLDASLNAVTSTVTDVQGRYLFADLLPAAYAVEFVAPTQYVFTVRDAAVTNDLADSDADRATGRTALMTLAAGTTNLTADAGVYIPAAVYGYLFVDRNLDLLRNAGDASITNTEVRLVSGGAVIATAATDANGYYRFEQVPPGTVSVLVSRTSGTLLAVPTVAPAATDPTRNRALPDKKGTDAYIAFSVVSGYGVLPGQPGEPLNVGFSTYTALSTAMDISLRATGKGGVMIELWTSNESGSSDIVVYAWLNNAWAEVGRVPAEEVVGEGSNRYRVHTGLLAADGAYSIKVVDESGYEHYSAGPVTVETIRLKAVRMDLKTLVLSFNTEPNGRYVVQASSDLKHWDTDYASWDTGAGWAAYDVAPFTARGTQTQVKVPAGRKQAFFKVVRVDE